MFPNYDKHIYYINALRYITTVETINVHPSMYRRVNRAHHRAILQVLTRGMSFVPTWSSSTFDCRMMNWMIPLNSSLSNL